MPSIHQKILHLPQFLQTDLTKSSLVHPVGLSDLMRAPIVLLTLPAQRHLEHVASYQCEPDKTGAVASQLKSWVKRGAVENDNCWFSPPFQYSVFRNHNSQKLSMWSLFALKKNGRVEICSYLNRTVLGVRTIERGCLEFPSWFWKWVFFVFPRGGQCLSVSCMSYERNWSVCPCSELMGRGSSRPLHHLANVSHQ